LPMPLAPPVMNAAGREAASAVKSAGFT